MTAVASGLDFIKNLNGSLVNGSNLDVYRYLKYNGDNFAALGTDLAFTESYTDAIKILTIAILLHPNDHRLYFNRAYCYLELDANEEALRNINVAIDLKPDWGKAHFKKGQILANMKDFFAADKAYKCAYLLDNDTETRMQITGNICEALCSVGFDPIMAGYASQYYFEIEEAADALNGGAFDLALLAIRMAKKEKFCNKKYHKVVPKTFY